jgi:hypothetical protein
VPWEPSRLIHDCNGTGRETSAISHYLSLYPRSFHCHVLDYVYLIWYDWVIVAKEQGPQKIPLVFFRTGAGTEPVRHWLRGLDEADRHAIGRDPLRAQWRRPVGMPLCRPMGRGLWEVRTDLPGNRTARVLICLCQAHLVAWHGFIKKNASYIGR